MNIPYKTVRKKGREGERRWFVAGTRALFFLFPVGDAVKSSGLSIVSGPPLHKKEWGFLSGRVVQGQNSTEMVARRMSVPNSPHSRTDCMSTST